MSCCLEAGFDQHTYIIYHNCIAKPSRGAEAPPLNTMFRWRRVHTSRSKIAPTDAPSKSSGHGIASPAAAIAENDECCFSALPQQLLEAILENLKDDMGRGNTKVRVSRTQPCQLVMDTLGKSSSACFASGRAATLLAILLYHQQSIATYSLACGA
jgi:hypothetical protein